MYCCLTCQDRKLMKSDTASKQMDEMVYRKTTVTHLFRV